jgi:uncharacterized protein YbaP (TraB family)
LRFRRFVAGLAALLTACATPAPSAQQSGTTAARPALWKLSDEDTTIYLFGTIHALPEGTRWRTAQLDQAVAASDTLVLEIAAIDPMEAGGVISNLGRSPGLPPLLERVPPDQREALAKRIEKLGIPPAILDGMETWSAAITLIAASFLQMGFDPAHGVERQLAADYSAAKKPVLGLETVAQQLGYFDALSEDAQRMLLLGAISEESASRAAFEQMVKAWISGDVDRIAETFNSETTLSPELRDILMRRRNRAWTEWIAKRLDQPGTVVVAVGAGHLAGRDSLNRMLKERGLRTRRVE